MLSGINARFKLERKTSFHELYTQCTTFFVHYGYARTDLIVMSCVTARREGGEDNTQGGFDPKDVDTVKLGASKSKKRKDSYDYADTVQVCTALSCLEINLASI